MLFISSLPQCVKWSISQSGYEHTNKIDAFLNSNFDSRDPVRWHLAYVIWYCNCPGKQKKMWHVWSDLLTIFYARVVLIKWVRISSLYTSQQPTVTQRTTLINSLRPSDAYICIGKLTIIGSDNGLSPDRRQAIIWTNAGLLLIGPLGTNFSEILIKILTFSFKKMRLKVSSAKWWPFCLGLNVLRDENRECVKAKHDILLRVASGSLIKTSM